MLLDAIQEALSLTARMHELAQAGDWFELFDVEQARSLVMQRFGELERETSARREYEPLLRELHARNEQVRLICEQARDTMRESIQNAMRAHAASRAYASA